MQYTEMLEKLDLADTLIMSVFYKLKQSGQEKEASLLLFEANTRLLSALEMIDQLND